MIGAILLIALTCIVIYVLAKISPFMAAFLAAALIVVIMLKVEPFYSMLEGLIESVMGSVKQLIGGLMK